MSRIVSFEISDNGSSYDARIPDFPVRYINCCSVWRGTLNTVCPSADLNTFILDPLPIHCGEYVLILSSSPHAGNSFGNPFCFAVLVIYYVCGILKKASCLLRLKLKERTSALKG